MPDIFDQRLKAIPKSEEITMQSNSSFTYPVTKSSTLTFYCFLSFHAGEIYTGALSSVQSFYPFYTYLDFFCMIFRELHLVRAVKKWGFGHIMASFY